jgi:hypothetical protein
MYVSREVQSSMTGWQRIDLSSSLSSNLKGATAKAKAFTVSQNVQSMAFDLGLIVTAAGSDHLFLSFGNSGNPASWKNIQWRAIPFDESDLPAPSPLTIDAVYLANLPSPRSPNGVQTCFVDIYQKPPASNPMKLLDRYYVSLKEAPFWRKHTLPIDLSAGSISCCLGRRENDRIGGIYTFGKINNKQQLIYAPAYNEYDVDIPPRPARLTLPAGSTGVAAAMNSNGKSNLFLSCNEGLYLFPPDSQHDEAAGNLIVPSTIAANAIDLEALSFGGTIGVFGVNPAGQLFYTHCLAGSEMKAEAWSPVVVLVGAINRYAFFINAKAGNHTLFAHSKGQDIVQLTQDPTTTEWVERKILLPGTDVNHVVSFNSFITKYQYSKGPGAPDRDVSISVTATSPIGVYINDAYYVLKPDVPVAVKPDTSGLLTIVQPSETSSATPYTFSVTATSETTFHDPAAKIRFKFQDLKTMKDLDNATCKNSDGSSSPLIPPGTSNEDKKALLDAFQRFGATVKDLPKDGSRSKAATAAKVPSPDAFGIGEFTIKLSVGDFFRIIGSAIWERIKTVTIKVVNGIVNVVTEIAGKVYHAVLDCISAVANAVEWAFNKVKVFTKDLIKWIGFIFNWSDIVRTHKVLKNVIFKYAKHSISQIYNVETAVASGLDDIDDKLRKWSGLPDRGGRLGHQADAGKDEKIGYGNPQASWVGDQASANLSSAELEAQEKKPAPEGWWAVLDELKNFVESEGDTVSQTIKDIRSKIVEPYSSLTAMEVVQRLIGVIGSLVVQSAKHIVVLVLRIIRILADKVIDGLDEPIKIPVISALYKKISGEELSTLDLLCLIAAAPATIIYKAVTNQTPFPDNQSTRALIEAPDYASIQQLFSGNDADTAARLKSFCVVAEFAGMAGSWFLTLLSKFKLPFVAANKPDKIPGFVHEISIPIRLLTLLPTIALGCIPEVVGGPGWETTMYLTMASIAFFKTVVDTSEIGDKDIYLKVSPYVDYAIAAIWIVPAVARLVKDSSRDSAYIVMGRALAADFALMLGPVVWNVADPEVRLIALAVTDGMYLVSAGLGVAAGTMMFKE